MLITNRSKPFLKWAGGKFKLVPFIESHLPTSSRKRLIEPFSGSAAVSMALEFESYLLNDTNSDLIGLFRTLKEEKQDFINYTHSFFSIENNQENRFYELREQFNYSSNVFVRSALFVYLNRHAFNGLCRYNNKGLFNVPFGRYVKPYFPEEEMQAFLTKANRVELLCDDFQAALNLANNEDIVYCDPPYVPLSKTASFTAYAQNRFDLEDQARLAECAKRISDQSIAVLISNHDTEFTRKIYHDARLEYVSVQRNIAAKGINRSKVSELLAIYGK